MKLLVIRYGAMGDLFHVSPALRVVKEMVSPLELHVLTSPLYEPLLKAWPEVDRVWCYEKKSGWRGLFSLMQHLKAQRYDGVINLHPAFKTWLLVRGLGCVRVATYGKQKFKLRGAALREQLRYHAVEDFYRPFQALLSLPEHSADTLIPRFSLPEILAPGGETRIALIPGVGGKRGNRAWPVEYFQALIRGLLEDVHTRVLLIGGPEEHAIAEKMMQAGLTNDSRVENHCGQHSLLETAALLSQCNGVVGGDTGPLHMAAALGLPIVGLFGPTDPRRTGPLGLQSLQTFTPPEVLSCWPCEYPHCPLPGEDHLACMKALSVESVLKACRAFKKDR